MGSFALYLYFFSGYFESRHRGKGYIVTIPLLCATFVGVLWEFFEFFMEQYVKQIGGTLILQPGLPDTLADFFFDMFGGVCAGVIFLLVWRKSLQ